MKISIDMLYQRLNNEFGELNWWPMDKKYHEKNNSDPRFEVIIGAILTQNTAWSNVEKALNNLKSKNMLNIKKITKCNLKDLQTLIKPSGFFNQKAERLKKIASYIDKKYSGDLNLLFKREVHKIRDELLSLNGIGPETADSILLYAGNMPIFVVDAYTKRLCRRLPLDTGLTYTEIQQFFQKNLLKKYTQEKITKVYNDLHAWIVNLGKIYCKKNPECDNCPLNDYCSYKK
jgi:endonuclease-3 related protein